MSTIDFPRVYMKGEISWDPSLSNNMRGLFDGNSVTLGPDVDASRPDSERGRLPMADVDLGGWNHFGTHDAEFIDVAVTGTSLAAGTYDDSDPVVGKRVEMKGKLVDFDPLVTHGTQIFFNTFNIEGPLAGLTAQRRKRMYVRFLNSTRNTGGLPIAGGAGAMAEVALPADGVEFRNLLQSPALVALEAAMGDPSVQGLLLRFHIYRTLYYRNGISNTIPQEPRNDSELRQFYANGENFSNPAVAYLVGVLMPWRDGEFEGYPAGRNLFPVAPSSPPIGNATAEFDRGGRLLTLDLGQTIPEMNENRDKHDVGLVVLKVRHGGTETELTTLSPSDYDQVAYERTAGLVDIVLPGTVTEAELDAIEVGDLVLEAGGADVLGEPGLVAVVEDRDIYLDAGDTRDIHIAVTAKGGPAPHGTQVYPVEYGGPTGPSVGAPLTVSATGGTVFVVPGGAATVRTYLFIAVPAGAPAPTAPNRYDSRFDGYLNVRYLPNDDALAANTPDTDLNWPFIYNAVFKVFDVTNPVMSRKVNPTIDIPLHDRQSMESKAQRIKEVIDSAQIETFEFMPVTRDLSRGKRQLLNRWCDLVLGGNVPLPAAVNRGSDDPRLDRVKKS